VSDKFEKQGPVTALVGLEEEYSKRLQALQPTVPNTADK